MSKRPNNFEQVTKKARTVLADAGVDVGQLNDSTLTVEDFMVVLILLQNQGYAHLMGSEIITEIRMLMKKTKYAQRANKLLMQNDVWERVLERERPRFYEYCYDYGVLVYEYMKRTEFAKRIADLYEMSLEELRWYLCFTAIANIQYMGNNDIGWSEDLSYPFTLRACLGRETHLLYYATRTITLVGSEDTWNFDLPDEMLRDIIFQTDAYYIVFENGIWRLSENGEMTVVSVPENLPIRHLYIDYVPNRVIVETIEDRRFVCFINSDALYSTLEIKHNEVSGLYYTYPLVNGDVTAMWAPSEDLPIIVDDKYVAALKNEEYVPISYISGQRTNARRNEISQQIISELKEGEIVNVVATYITKDQTSQVYGNFHLLCKHRFKEYAIFPMSRVMNIKYRWAGEPDAAINARLLRKEAKLASNYQKGCAQCGKKQMYRCKCGVKYCSETCYREAYDAHLALCSYA